MKQNHFFFWNGNFLQKFSCARLFVSEKPIFYWAKMVHYKKILYIHPSSKSKFYLKKNNFNRNFAVLCFCFWKANLLLSQNGPFWRVDKVYGCTTTLFALWFVAAVKKLTFLKSQIRKIRKEMCIFHFFELQHCKIAMGFGCRSGDS